MSTSHAAVGLKFGRAQPAKGSRMESITTSVKLGPHFTLVARGISYSTPIAQIVVNHHTGLSEFWVTPVYYSASTNRHEAYFRDGFITAFTNNHGCSREDAYRQVFTTSAVHHTARDRCDKEFARRLLDAVHNQLMEVDRPRLRSATRMGNIDGALYKTREAIKRMAHGVPADYPDAETLYELQDMEAFLANTLALSDIDDVRTAVRAWLTLNDPKNN